MKKIFAAAGVIAGFCLQAQSIGNSPYAAVGLGDVKYDNTLENSSMGGISTAYITDFHNSFNFKNPAANQNLELTSIKLEATNENNFFRSDYNDLKSTKHSTYLSNISIAFPLSQKVKFGLGYQPYSSKRYNIAEPSTAADGTTILRSYQGNGSVNTVNAGLSYALTQNFSLGLRANYYFGKVTDLQELSVLNADNSYNNGELTNGYFTSNKLKTFNFTVGTAYQKVNDVDQKFTAGATLTFGNTGKNENEYINSTYFYADEIKTLETIIDQRTENTKNLLPIEASVGIGYGHVAKWMISGQVDYRKGEDISFVGSTLENRDMYRISAGGYYLPNYNDFRNYFQRITYRYGAYFEKGSLYLNGHNINKYGITAGVSLPFKNSTVNRTNSLDIGLELGKRGTAKDNLINQNFINLKVGINFADKWFNKSLYQ